MTFNAHFLLGMNGYLFALLFALLPAFFAIQMVRTGLFVRKMQRRGILAQGLIISQRHVQRAQRPGAARWLPETYQIPRVKFRTLEGQVIEGESWRRDKAAEFFDGDEAYLRYDPTKPTDFLFVQELVPPPYWQLALIVFFLLIAVGAAVETALEAT